MKLCKAHIALLMIPVILAGCRMKDHGNETLPDPGNSFQTPAKETKERKTAKSGYVAPPFRFEVLTAEDDAKSSQPQQLSSQVSEYYIPVENIHRSKSIRSRLETRNGDNPSIKSGTRDPAIQEMEFFCNGMTSNEVMISLTVDNDLFDYTDHYYTSGQSLELFHPAISMSPFTYLLPSLKASYNYFSISLFQNLYTPLFLTRDYILTGDRPFASYLCIGHRKYSLQPDRLMRLETHLDLGIIGPGSLGKISQDIFHTDTPVGWMYQVDNDFVFNYFLRFEQGIFHKKNFDMAYYVGGQAGSLYDNLVGGVFLQAGKTNGRYQSLFLTTPANSLYKKRIRFYFNLDLENKMVLYDATLQGGMFNLNSVYTILDENMKRYVFTGRAGFGIGLGPLSVEAEQVFLTPEFDGGKHHFWFRIKIMVHLN